METYKNIKWHYEFRTWLGYSRAMRYIGYAVSHIAMSITEIHSTDEHIDLIQNLTYELHGKLLRCLEGVADYDDFTRLELIGLCIPKKLSLTEAYIAEAMIMILKHLEEDTDKVKLFNHITEECNRLESLLSWIRNIQENTFRSLLWKKYSKH